MGGENTIFIDYKHAWLSGLTGSVFQLPNKKTCYFEAYIFTYNKRSGWMLGFCSHITLPSLELTANAPENASVRRWNLSPFGMGELAVRFRKWFHQWTNRCLPPFFLLGLRPGSHFGVPNQRHTAISIAVVLPNVPEPLHLYWSGAFVASCSSEETTQKNSWYFPFHDILVD